MRLFFPPVSLREKCDFLVWWALSGVAPPRLARSPERSPRLRTRRTAERQGPGTLEGAPGQSRTSPDPPAVPSVLFTSPGMVCALFLSFTEHPKSPSLISPDEVRKMLAPNKKWAAVSLWNTTQAFWSLCGNLNYRNLVRNIIKIYETLLAKCYH